MKSQSEVQFKKDQIHSPFIEKIKNLPSVFGIRLVDEPYYTVVKSDNDFEIRRYDPMTLASITIRSDHEAALQEGFMRLAAYTSGFNSKDVEIRLNSTLVHVKQNEEIPMTAPVLQERCEIGWTISFILPKEYNQKNTPVPEDSQVYLYREPSRVIAALRYSGVNDLAKMEEKSQKLYKWLEEHTEYRPTAHFRCAEYDGPLTVPFLKRNEVMVRVERVYTH